MTCFLPDDILGYVTMSETLAGSLKNVKLDNFAKTVYGFQLLAIDGKFSILDVCGNFVSASLNVWPYLGICVFATDTLMCFSKLC